MRRRACLLASLLGLVNLCAVPLVARAQPSRSTPTTTAPAFGPADAAMKVIRAGAVRAHIRFLADRRLEGRRPGTPGHEMAARYIAAQIEALGLEPAGAAGTWFQPVPLRTTRLDPARSSLTLVRPDKPAPLKMDRDFVLLPDAARPRVEVDAPLVFVGYGVSAPQLGYDDYADVDVRGRVVVMLSNAPPRFPATERALHADTTEKARTAVAHGAVGLIFFLSPEDQKRMAWSWLAPQLHDGMSWLDGADLPHGQFPELKAVGMLSQRGAELGFAGAAQSLEQVFARAAASEPQAFPLPGRIRIRTTSVLGNVQGENVLGLLPGTDLRDQVVVYTAHLDHLGRCAPVNGDAICHGAYDNASGVAAALEIARAFKALARGPRRSILFAFVTGEEMGLLGAEYLAYHPPVPLRRLVAELNIDGGGGAYCDFQDVIALGAEHSDLAQAVRAVAAHLNLEVTPDPMPEEVFFIRSDQYPFVRQGVPSLLLGDGVKDADPKVSCLEVGKTWLSTRYHTPLDDFDPGMNYEAMARWNGFAFQVGLQIADRDRAPAWNPNDPFGTRFGVKHDRDAGTD